MNPQWRCSYFISLLLLTCCFQALASENLGNLQLEFPENTLFVSLGSTCTPAEALRSFGLRKSAFPFDWILSVDGMKVIELLDDNFAFFIDAKYLQPNTRNGILVHLRYHLEFVHEEKFIHDEDSLGAPYFKNLEEMQAKYARRVERFKQLRNFPGKVYFFRINWALSTHPHYAFPDEGNLHISVYYASQLFHALKRFFPELDFDLIIINDEKEKINFEEIKLTDRIRIFSGTGSTHFKKIFDTLITERNG